MALDFVFTYEGETFWTNDLTLDEAIEVQEKVGKDWPEWQPIRDLRLGLVLMTMFLRRNRSEDEVAVILKGLTKGAVYKLWDRREEDLPEEYTDGVPFGAAGASTPTP